MVKPRPAFTNSHLIPQQRAILAPNELFAPRSFPSNPTVLLTLLEPQSRFGGKLLTIKVFCPHIWECGAKGVKVLVESHLVVIREESFGLARYSSKNACRPAAITCCRFAHTDPSVFHAVLSRGWARKNCRILSLAAHANTNEAIVSGRLTPFMSATWRGWLPRFRLHQY